MALRIYHNPRCSKSRQTLEIIRGAGIEPEIVLYLQDAPSATEIAELAQKHSSCPSGQRGGDLGEFGPGMMVPEFDKVVFSADVGTVQGPVRTQFGYHLLEVTSRTD